METDADREVRGSPTPTTLIVDWGGVLTNSLDSVMTSWTAEEDFEAAHFSEVMRGWFGTEAGAEAQVNPVHTLERGELEVPHFEQHLAEGLARATGREVTPDGLLARLFEHFEHAEDMTALVRRARASGLRTALLSNSWGDHYPEHIFDGMFEEVVISGRVGMRKPDPEIFRYTADLLAIDPAEAVFVDDLPHNITAAAGMGFIGVLHVDYATTADELSVIFDRDLRR